MSVRATAAVTNHLGTNWYCVSDAQVAFFKVKSETLNQLRTDNMSVRATAAVTKLSFGDKTVLRLRRASGIL
ncbi:hypothetical protein [Runella sp. MFBS21]|uniref:hypothetical protein n=1 Tax=Runella sp. MFBS21 TaxID=3034018 RepID=UPI0023FA04B6|nr:hypothetical protein [Runella sp. MFBS21]